MSPCGSDSLILPCGFPPTTLVPRLFSPSFAGRYRAGLFDLSLFFCPSFWLFRFLVFAACRFAAAKVFRIHLRPAFPPTSRPPRGLTVGEGPLAAAPLRPPWLGGNRLDSALRLDGPKIPAKSGCSLRSPPSSCSSIMGRFVVFVQLRSGKCISRATRRECRCQHHELDRLV